ncbi:MAG: type IV pilus assembly protein PilM [Candidatus Pacebacteria bacterium]|nr:type IV pilus assembly protein PilM [Candidatus Paceibacterota bacterium]
MIWFPFKVSYKNLLGIDIGTSSIKIVELSRRGDKIKLENYGEMSADAFYEKPFRSSDGSMLLLSNSEIAKAILAILEEAKISEKKANFSIPDFSTFFVDFELPPMTKNELPEAVRFSAKQYIPMPLSEVTLDWAIIEGAPKNGGLSSSSKILLVAIPNTIIRQYQEIASLANLKLQSIEAEAFGLLRALVKEDKKTICLVDIGAQSVTVNIVDKGILKKSHSFDISGNEITQVISKSLNVDVKEAEYLKREKGLLLPELAKVLIPLVDFIIAEIEKTSHNFRQTDGKEIEKIILAGGSSLLPGLKKYFLEALKTEVEIGDPFLGILYPEVLSESLAKFSPSYAIAVGMALKGL